MLRPAIDLDLHIEDIVQVLEYEDLKNVILVGHSYGGMVIAGVADRAAGRIETSFSWMPQPRKMDNPWWTSPGRS